MDKKEKIKVFEDELSTINDSSLKKFAKLLLEDAEEWFFTAPASSSGKYHPDYARSHGGLALHTKAVIMFANEIIRTEMFEINEHEADLIRIACLIHDIKKYGDVKKNMHTLKNHPELASEYLQTIYKKNKKLVNKEDVDIISNMVISHMGIYGDIKPNTILEKIVHIADSIASRKNVEVQFATKEGKDTVISPGEYILEFGMHSGKKLNEVPKDYLDWCLKNVKKPVLISSIKRFLKEEKNK